MGDPLVHKAQKLSVVRRGHWRSRWFSKRDCHFPDGERKAGEWLGITRWPSAEIAEQKALEWLRTYPDFARTHGMRHLGVVFFPDGNS